MKVRLPAAAAVALTGLSAAAQGFDDYPFLGAWTCGGATYTFTVETFNDGTADFPVYSITEASGNFTVNLASGTQIDMSAVTDSTMSLVSEATGAMFDCTR